MESYKVPVGCNSYYWIKKLLKEIKKPGVLEIEHNIVKSDRVVCYPGVSMLELLTQLPVEHRKKSLWIQYEINEKHSITGHEKDLLRYIITWTVQGHLEWFEDYSTWEETMWVDVKDRNLPRECLSQRAFEAYKEFQKWYCSEEVLSQPEERPPHINIRSLLTDDSHILTLSEGYIGNIRSVNIRFAGDKGSSAVWYKLLKQLMPVNYVVSFEHNLSTFKYIWTKDMTLTQRMGQWPDGSKSFIYLTVQDKFKDEGFRMNYVGLAMLRQLIKEAITTKMLLSESSIREKLNDSRVGYIGPDKGFRVGDYQKKVMDNLNNLLIDLEIVKE